MTQSSETLIGIENSNAKAPLSRFDPCKLQGSEQISPLNAGMQSLAASKSLTITNPLVLYRALVATQKLQPDGAQYRLAAHLQNIYHRLKDYEPEVDYRERLRQASSALASRPILGKDQDGLRRSLLSTLWSRNAETQSLALTRRLTDREAAVAIDSPQGLLLHGEVGTGKSMLIDLLASSLPTKKKRRWHFNAFMLELYAMLDEASVFQRCDGHGLHSEYSLLKLARDLVRDSPIIFLDEFQLPDRAVSKILANLFNSFFQLGGVLVATSNRMPEELSRAAGIEFVKPARTTVQGSAPSQAVPSQPESDFVAFLDVLRARCEVWRLEGSKDWRREAAVPGAHESVNVASERADAMGSDSLQVASYGSSTSDAGENRGKTELPPYYMVGSSEGAYGESLGKLQNQAVVELFSSTSSETPPAKSMHDLPWRPSSVKVYGRLVDVPRTLNRTTMWHFYEICGRTLGPADYISLASLFDTFVLTEVPVLTSLQKNEARRFITLLDALYEAKCKLLVCAEAGPDETFFSESRGPASNSSTDRVADQVHPETLSEIYQDRVSPFRPNISAYKSSASAPSYEASPLPAWDTRVSQAQRRSILADEDSDFGPLSPTARLHQDVGTADETALQSSRDGVEHTPETGDNAFVPLDFRKTSAFTGEDEYFAYKRAVSRLWQLCSADWWERNEDGWWTPVRPELRKWQ